MRLKMTPRRMNISNLFEQQDYSGLEQAGIRIVDDPGNFDCANYVLHYFGLPGRPELLNVLANIEKSETYGNVAFYGVWQGSKFNVRHYGVFEQRRVQSKWGLGPVLEHRVEDVPIMYGDTVLFGTIDDTVKARMRQALQGMYF